MTEAPANNSVDAAPVLPTLLTVNDIKLFVPLAVGKLGVDPDGNKKYVLNPTVAIPELVILTV